MVDMRPPRLRQSQHYPFPEVEPSGLNCLFQSSTSSQNHIFTSSLPSAWGKELQLPFLPNGTNRVAMWWSVAQLTNRVTTSPTALSAQMPSRAVPSSQEEYRLWSEYSYCLPVKTHNSWACLYPSECVQRDDV
ncbi:uncharacterized protein ARMOST_14394 [Armillaria ostoyae]|uniref:Uncharacterized protein n=1 Tax=Armillaria ostoyae TaxID=47428 RepID=A0A284RQE6_ARMOS|nr:uncharacterized protein ARMOST_14394 [Armillaria ostoyae]